MATAAKAAPKASGDVNWNQLLEDLQSGGNANFIFTKKPKNRIRLVRDPEQVPYIEVASTFRRNGVEGRTRTKFMILAVDLSAEDTDDEGPKVKGLVVSKTVFRQVVGLITEGYELWDPENGHGITISKTGQGLQTTYTVMPSQKVVPLDPDLLEDLPQLADLKEEYTKFSERPGAKDDAEAEADY